LRIRTPLSGLGKVDQGEFFERAAADVRVYERDGNSLPDRDSGQR